MRNLVIVLMLFPAWSLAATVKDDALQTCMDVSARLDRLSCYDALFGVVPDPLDAQAKGINPLREARKPEAHRHFDRLMASKYKTENGVTVSFWDALNQKDIHDLEDFPAFLDAGWNSELTKLFVHDTSVFVAIASNAELGEAGGLVASCENNISHLRFFWDAPIEGRVIEATLLFGDDISQTRQVERMRMRITDEGYVINTPRGLEAINVLQTIGQGPRGQVSIGKRENLRSLFFETEPLSDALPIISRHCGWTLLQKVE